MIHKFKINSMGTVDFHGKFLGMRKEQDFVVYPMPVFDPVIKIQSDKCIGRVCLDTGKVRLSGKHPGEILPEEERMVLREWVKKSGSKELVGGVVKTDNSGALEL